MEAIEKWHEFFTVLGAAAGTLIGAMFVVVSIGSGLVKQSTLASRVYVTPTIVHLAFVLMGCALMLVPILDRLTLGTVADLGGIIFLGYAARNIFYIHRQSRVHWSDYLWYGLCPVISYLAIIGGAALILEGRSGGIEIVAFALALLVVSGIRNAWDLILFFLERNSAGGTLPPPP
jgi:hypothetical protein